MMLLSCDLCDAEMWYDAKHRRSAWIWKHCSSHLLEALNLTQLQTHVYCLCVLKSKMLPSIRPESKNTDKCKSALCASWIKKCRHEFGVVWGWGKCKSTVCAFQVYKCRHGCFVFTVCAQICVYCLRVGLLSAPKPVLTVCTSWF